VRSTEDPGPAVRLVQLGHQLELDDGDGHGLGQELEGDGQPRRWGQLLDAHQRPGGGTHPGRGPAGGGDQVSRQLVAPLAAVLVLQRVQVADADARDVVHQPLGHPPTTHGCGSAGGPGPGQEGAGQRGQRPGVDVAGQASLEVVGGRRGPVRQAGRGRRHD
jgi:hypothetical protein